MSKNRNALVVVVVLALMLIAFVVYKIGNSKKKSRVDGTDKNQVVMEAAKTDRAALADVLKNKAVPENLVYGAMIRLGQDGDSEALEVAKKIVNHESKYLREGAAQALGYFSDENVLPDLRTLTSDREESVRVFAIQALGTIKSASREKVVEEILAKPSLSAAEKVATHGSLYRLRSDLEKQKKDLEQILILAHKPDSELSKKAMLLAMSLATDAKGIKDLMIEKIKQSKDDNIKAVAIRNLANSKDQWLKDRLLELATTSSVPVKIAAVQSVHRVCPESRWDLIDSIIRKEKEESVANHAFEELLFLNRSKAVSLLEKYKSDSSLSDVRRKTASTFAESIKSKPDIDVCK